MTDSTKPSREDRIDRYVRSELTPAEARDLAQESLDSPGLFEELSYSAVAKTALSARTVGGSKVVRFRSRAWFPFAGVAAAAVVGIALYLVGLSGLGPKPELTAGSQPKPVLAFSADPSRPVLLASGLQPAQAGREGSPVFRSPEPDSRAPQQAGSIVLIEDDQATINLGSLDGLKKGSQLQVFRDGRSTEAIGILQVTTVFRERARGTVLRGQGIQVNNQVRVAGADHLDALLEQLDAISNRGELEALRAMAEKAAAWTETANVSPGEKRKALARLAAIEYQAGSLEAAEKHYQLAVDSVTATEPSEALNNLAVLRLLRGDYTGAEAPLRQAVSTSSKTDTAYGRSVNNLGVLAELRGDRQKAVAFYADALRVFAGVADSPAQERRVVETNLTRVRGSR